MQITKLALIRFDTLLYSVAACYLRSLIKFKLSRYILNSIINIFNQFKWLPTINIPNISTSFKNSYYTINSTPLKTVSIFSDVMFVTLQQDLPKVRNMSMHFHRSDHGPNGTISFYYLSFLLFLYKTNLALLASFCTQAAIS